MLISFCILRWKYVIMIHVIGDPQIIIIWTLIWRYTVLVAEKCVVDCMPEMLLYVSKYDYKYLLIHCYIYTFTVDTIFTIKI